MYEDSFLKGAVPTLSEADRAFQAVRCCDWELAYFYSYHLDRFGYSAAASPANQQDVSSVTIGLTPFGKMAAVWFGLRCGKELGFRHLQSPCFASLWCLPLSFL